MLATDQPQSSIESEADLRRRFDRCVSRALVDREYAGLLLANPTLILEDRGCPPQAYRSLRSIEATTLNDFARQAYALFWAPAPHVHELVEQEPLPLAS